MFESKTFRINTVLIWDTNSLVELNRNRWVQTGIQIDKSRIRIDFQLWQIWPAWYNRIFLQILAIYLEMETIHSWQLLRDKAKDTISILPDWLLVVWLSSSQCRTIQRFADRFGSETMKILLPLYWHRLWALWSHLNYLHRQWLVWTNCTLVSSLQTLGASKSDPDCRWKIFARQTIIRNSF